MDFDIVMIINCGSISKEYLVMQATQPKNVESMREEELCNNRAKHIVHSIASHSKHLKSLKWTQVHTYSISLIVIIFRQDVD